MTEPVPLHARGAVTLLLWYFGVQLLAGVILGGTLGVYLSITSADPQAAVHRLDASIVLPFAILSLAVSTWVLVRKARASFPGAYWPTILHGLGWREANRLAIGLSATLGLLLSSAYRFFVLPAFPPRPGQHFGPLTTAAASSTSAAILWAILAVILAPPVEEFLFRGLLFTGFARSWGRDAAILAVTMLFVAAHLTETRGYWPALGAITILGFSTMAARLATGSIWPGIALHSAYNLGLVVVVLGNTG